LTYKEKCAKIKTQIKNGEFPLLGIAKIRTLKKEGALMKTYDPFSDITIDKTAENMIGWANTANEPIQTQFNGVSITVRPSDNPETIIQNYLAKLDRHSKEYINSPAHKKQQQKSQEIHKRHNRLLDKALSTAPAKMTLRDEDGWNKAIATSADRLDNEIIRFAERWARLMENQMIKGTALEACAEKSYLLANNNGITGFMRGRAVYILSQVWIHGEQLRRWRNLKRQINHEGEKANGIGNVISPAILSLSPR